MPDPSLTTLIRKKWSTSNKLDQARIAARGYHRLFAVCATLPSRTSHVTEPNRACFATLYSHWGTPESNCGLIPAVKIRALMSTCPCGKVWSHLFRNCMKPAPPTGPQSELLWPCGLSAPETAKPMIARWDSGGRENGEEIFQLQARMGLSLDGS
ncbi:hypothetical protein BDW75DRAFT_64728 [Aspergillus navahoensis]